MQASLLTTLERIRQKLPECADVVDRITARVRHGWSPTPQEFMAYLAGVAASDELRKKYHDIMLCYTCECLENAGVNTTQASANIGKKY